MKHLPILLIACGALSAAAADGTFTVSVPSDATLFVGTKQKHYMPFKACTPSDSTAADGVATYTFPMSDGFDTYAYRLQLPGAMTHVGKFGIDSEHTAFAITRAEMLSHGTADYCNHNAADNSAANLADLLLNVTRSGHLQLQPGEQKALVANRVWQIVDDDCNNYFLSPDYHYAVVDEHFQPSNAVVTIDADGLLTAVGTGTAIVMVDYDACYAYGYNKVDGYYVRNADYKFWFGATWSRLWAENTGIFVVTVGQDTFSPEIRIDCPNQDREELALDSELDVLYYLADSDGYHYALAADGVASVEVANPAVDSDANTVSYSGFRSASPDDILLTFGRNILRLTDSAGRVAYQVISAKPITADIPDQIKPGDEVTIQLSGLYHPTPKLAGIYNQSAYLHYAIDGDDDELTLGSGQYNFAGSAKAQRITLTVPSDYAETTLTLSDGAIHVSGFGFRGGLHRQIDPAVGINPNLNAELTSEFWGALPDITLKIAQPFDAIREITDEPASAPQLYDLSGRRVSAPTPGGLYIDASRSRLIRL